MHPHSIPSLPDCSVTFPDTPENGIPLRKYSDEIVQDSDLLPYYPPHHPKMTGGTVCSYSFVFMNSIYYNAISAKMQAFQRFSCIIYIFSSAR